MLLRSQSITAMLPLIGCIVMLGGEAFAQTPLWSRGAIVLDKSCSPAAARILSPDRSFAAEVRCTGRNILAPTYSLRLHAGRKQIAEIPLAAGTHEIVWSPDSHSFLLNGGETGYAGYFVKVYTIDEQAVVREHDVTSLAQRDMVDTFPPCKAANLRDDCKRMEANPEYNMSGLGFTPDSKIVFVFAEIPCSPTYGGIKCQSRGYEVDVASGQILQRLSAQQVQLHWQRLAAWDINLPDPPVYDNGATP